MEHIPYAIPDSPQSKYYVQLLKFFPPGGCVYGTYWKYGRNSIFNPFPSHWFNGSTVKVGNYLKFNYTMIHSNTSAAGEDHWYTSVNCQVDSGETYPCREIYFKKNTDIPLRLVEVIYIHLGRVIQVKINFTIISIGKPEDKYFDLLPKNWSLICQDYDLGVSYDPQAVKIAVNQSSKIQVWLSSPPHQIDGNDSVIIRWKPFECTDCFVFSPKELVFNSKNFHEKQVLTVTRVNASTGITFLPVFQGGGFELVPADSFSIYVE